jgi:endonuclease/exonuclease/phosphatase family metal-dependent hydrolase
MSDNSPTGLRVLSYNLHKGMTAANRRFVLQNMRSAIRSVHPDVVFLQEVQDQNQRRAARHPEWPSEGQCEFLADTIWPHHAYGRNALYTHGHHGNAILSKYPFTAWENIDISNNRFERRGLLHGVIEHPLCREPLHVLCCHFDLFERGRKKQVQRLIERINAHIPAHAPLIIAGDFNDWRGRISDTLFADLNVQEAHQHLHGVHARTFPAWFPVLPLDRLYVRDLSVLSARTLTGDPWAKLSDHAALLAELQAKSQAESGPEQRST